MSSQFIKSTTDVLALKEGLQNVTKELESSRAVVKRNTTELKKINSEVEKNRQDKITELDTAIKKLEMQTQWISYDEDREVGLDPDHILKKLDIL